MSAETIAALSAVSAALVGAGPSYLALRRARGAAHTEGEATREAVSTAVTTAVAELRGEVRAVRLDVREVREWQAAHTAEHVLLNHNRPEE